MREFFVANAALLDRRVPSRRPAARRDAGHLRRLAASTSSPRSIARRARAAAGRGRSTSSAENEPQDTHARPRRRTTAATASTRCGTTTSITRARGRADRPARGVLHATTAARRRSSSRRAKYGFLYQGQWYAWQKQRARHAGARPAAARVRRPFSRTTIRSRTPPSAGGCTSSTSPGPLSRDDRAAAARARRRRCCSRGRSSRRPRRSSTSPITSRSWRSRCAKGRREFLAQFPSLTRSARSQPRCRRRPTRRRSQRCKLDLAERERHARVRTRCTAICSRCGATIRCFARRGATGVDGAVLGAGRVRAAFLRRATATTGCCSSTSGCDLDLHAGAGAAARAAVRLPLGGGVDQRGAALRRRRHAAGATASHLARSRRSGAFCCAPKPGRSTTTGQNDDDAEPSRIISRPQRSARRRSTRRRAASGSSPTAWAATPPARSPACVTRRYHGLLIAALPAPLGRMVMLNHLLERVRLPDRHVRLARRRGRRWPDRTPPIGTEHLAEFRLELGLPVWRYERRRRRRSRSASLMPHGQNTVHVTYRLLEGERTGPARAAAVGALPRLRSAGRRVAGAVRTR